MMVTEYNFPRDLFLGDLFQLNEKNNSWNQLNFKYIKKFNLCFREFEKSTKEKWKICKMSNIVKYCQILSNIVKYQNEQVLE